MICCIWAVLVSMVDALGTYAICTVCSMMELHAVDNDQFFVRSIGSGHTEGVKCKGDIC